MTKTVTNKSRTYKEKIKQGRQQVTKRINKKKTALISKKNREAADTTLVIDGHDTERCENYTYNQQKEFNIKWEKSNRHFDNVFNKNEFGFACNICDRLWFNNDLQIIKPTYVPILIGNFPNEDVNNFKVCSTCRQSLSKNKVLPLSRSNGFKYPPKPTNLPTLDAISERLISPRLPFMQIRRLRYQGNYGIIGQVINVPVDVNNMVNQLPRQLDEDFAFNVNIKENLIHKSVYLHGFVKKYVIKEWLKYLIDTPLYKHYNIYKLI